MSEVSDSWVSSVVSSVNTQPELPLMPPFRVFRRKGASAPQKSSRLALAVMVWSHVVESDEAQTRRQKILIHGCPMLFIARSTWPCFLVFLVRIESQRLMLC